MIVEIKRVRVNVTGKFIFILKPEGFDMIV